MLIFKRYLISDDVHHKTISTLMGGVESIASKEMHRNKAQELFAYYDEKYIKKLVLHEAAVDLMVLKAQKITMEDHYATLYGPRIIAHKKIDSVGHGETTTKETVIGIEPTLTKQLSKRESQSILAKGFSSHPYSRYSSRIDSLDSEEDLEQLIKERKNKASLIWQTAFTKSRRLRLQEKNLLEEETLGDERETEGNTDIRTIFEIYKEVRDESNTNNDDKFQ